MKDIKITKTFWDLIVSGKKTKEFRKLSKGIIGGTYRFVSISSKKLVPDEIYGTATLRPERMNPGMWEATFTLPGFTQTGQTNYFYGTTPEITNANYEYCPICDEDTHQIDRNTYKFVEDNYINKFDFIVYDITNVKDLSSK